MHQTFAPLSTSDERNALLEAIKMGKDLRKVSEEDKQEPYLLDTLYGRVAVAMDDRRPRISSFKLQWPYGQVFLQNTPSPSPIHVPRSYEGRDDLLASIKEGRVLKKRANEESEKTEIKETQKWYSAWFNVLPVESKDEKDDVEW